MFDPDATAPIRTTQTYHYRIKVDAARFYSINIGRIRIPYVVSADQLQAQHWTILYDWSYC